MLKQFFPEVVAEIQGITDVIEHDPELFTAWMMCMGCCLELQAENRVEVRGCTAFSFNHQGQVYYARNNDLPPLPKGLPL